MAGSNGKKLAAIVFGLGLSWSTAGLAQTAAPVAPVPTIVQPPSSAAPQLPSAPAAPHTPAVASPGAPPEADSGAGQTLDVAARPAIVVHGQASWDDGYKAIMTAIGKGRAAALKANLKEAGRPFSAFVDTDDNGFKFDAMIPIETAPNSALALGPDVKLGATPAGKAIKFQHRGAYDDVDSTYEAITAYLDEKGYDAQNVFVEEFLNDPKGSDDTALGLDIYVFVK